MDSSDLNNHFLLAMPSLQDPNFQRAVIYVCEHNASGSVGIIVNRPTNMTLEQIFEQMQLSCELEAVKNIPVLFGGPVHQERGFVLHPPFGEWNSTLETGKDITVTSSSDIIEALARGEGPEQVAFAVGYAGWEAGQLEKEIVENSWLVTPAAPEIIFTTPHNKRWEKSGELIGVDINKISHLDGHA